MIALAPKSWSSSCQGCKQSTSMPSHPLLPCDTAHSAPTDCLQSARDTSVTQRQVLIASIAPCDQTNPIGPFSSASLSLLSFISVAMSTCGKVMPSPAVFTMPAFSNADRPRSALPTTHACGWNRLGMRLTSMVHTPFRPSLALSTCGSLSRQKQS